jgi:putative flippase GtrA
VTRLLAGGAAPRPLGAALALFPILASRPITELFRYALGSIVALAIDYGLLVLLTEVAGLHYLVSAAIGFCSGLIVIYLMSIRFVFEERRLESASLEFATFVAIGIAGLALNQLLLWSMVTLASLSYALAKVPTAGVVFLFNFTVRRSVLFSRS